MRDPDGRRFAIEALRMTGGLLAWGAHLALLYGLSALACAPPALSRTALHAGALVATAAALGACLALLAHALRDLRRDATAARRLASEIAASVAFVALAAVAWSGSAMLLVEPCDAGAERVARAAPVEIRTARDLRDFVPMRSLVSFPHGEQP
jgi:hypothetical protein